MTASAAPLYPIVMALITAFLFGISSLVVQFGLRHADARTGALYSIGTTAAMYWLMLPFFLPGMTWSLSSLKEFVAWFAMIGVFTPGISLMLAFEGNRLLGPTISSTLASTAPVFAITSAILILGERPPPMVLLGATGVVMGVVLLSWRGRASRDWRLWAILFPLGAAFLRGGIHTATRYGLMGMSAPFLAALVSFNAAFLTAALRERVLRPQSFRFPGWPGFRMFALTGVLNGVALILMNISLMTGQVSVVSPLVSTFPLFTFFFSMVLRVERLNWRMIVGMMVVVMGVAAISAR